MRADQEAIIDLMNENAHMKDAIKQFLREYETDFRDHVMVRDALNNLKKFVQP